MGFPRRSVHLASREAWVSGDPGADGLAALRRRNPGAELRQRVGWVSSRAEEAVAGLPPALDRAVALAQQNRRAGFGVQGPAAAADHEVQLPAAAVVEPGSPTDRSQREAVEPTRGTFLKSWKDRCSERSALDHQVQLTSRCRSAFAPPHVFGPCHTVVRCPLGASMLL